MSSVIFHNGNKLTEFTHDSEKEYESVIKSNAKLLFGTSTIYIDLKARISSAALGDTIPDGIMFDMKDSENPDFYLVEIELAKHDFYRHIFTQVTKFIGFFRNPQARNQLVEKAFAIIQSDRILEAEFRKYLKGREIFKFLKDAADDSQNILIVIDNMKPELPDILNTYTEWSRMVRVLVLKEYRSGEHQVILLDPDFQSVELGESPDNKPEDEDIGKIQYTEEYHLEGSEPIVREMYSTIKDRMLLWKSDLRFNPRKYYISLVHKRNFAFVYVRKKKLVITIMLPEAVIRNAIKHHKVQSEAESVQRFYGGECATVTVENMSNLDEVINVLKMPVNK